MFKLDTRRPARANANGPLFGVAALNQICAQYTKKVFCLIVKFSSNKSV